MTRGVINPMTNQPFQFGYPALGRQAFLRGESISECPYPVGSQARVGWRAGYLAENKAAYEAENGIVNPKIT